MVGGDQTLVQRPQGWCIHLRVRVRFAFCLGWGLGQGWCIHLVVGIQMNEARLGSHRNVRVRASGSDAG